MHDEIREHLRGVMGEDTPEDLVNEAVAIIEDMAKREMDNALSGHRHFVRSLECPIEDIKARLTEKNLSMLFAYIGFMSEAGEYGDILKRHIFYEEDLNHQHCRNELGDISYFFELMMHHSDTNYLEIIKTNYEKLLKRYPDGFFDVNRSKRNIRPEGEDEGENQDG